jgi:hypothetical protein
MTPSPRTRDQLVWLLTVALAGLGAFAWLQAPTLPQVGPALSWPLLAVLFAASERFAVHLPVGRETHSTSFSEVPLVLGLFFASADDLIIGRLVGACALLLVAHRGRGNIIKIAFNLAQFLLQTIVAIFVFSAIVHLPRWRLRCCPSSPLPSSSRCAAAGSGRASASALSAG